MMRKVYCDGCDKELGNGIAINEVIVTISSGGESVLADSFDLCNGCKAAIKCEADPKRWARVKAA